ncbi:hypothetical protein [Pseudorhodobacter sp.]|uniref:hypothetical protein n=1 Tax=Pseudorhodobacter sp. TaxID=1934400 RepID=UPI0039E4B67B
MNPRNRTQKRQDPACALSSVSWGGLAGVPRIFSLGFKGVQAGAAWISPGRRRVASRFGELAPYGAPFAIFLFSLRLKALDLPPIKTLERGYAVCVNLFFFSCQSPRLAWLAVFRTQIHQPITPQCAPLAAPLQVPLLPMQPAAAKPRARLSARWWAAFPVAFLAFLLATDVAVGAGLTAPHTGRRNNFHKAIRGIPRMAFLHFRAPRAFPRKGCYV